MQEEKQATILVVDDEVQMVDIVERFLNSAGFTNVVKAYNGEEALEVLREEEIDLVILDILMPGTNGYEVIEQMRASEKTMLIPVIVVTALRAFEDRTKIIEIGADDFITKPYEKTELLIRVRSLLRIKLLYERLEKSIFEKNAIEKQMIQASKLAALGQLAAGVAREMRNPLGIIGTSLFYVESVLKVEDPKLKRHFGIMTSELERVRRIIDNMLAFSRQATLEVQEIDVNEILQQAVSLFWEHFRASGVETKLDLGEVSRVRFNIDELKQAVLNIMSNSMEAMPDGGTLEIRTYEEDKQVKIRFTDGGRGISSEDLPRVFDPFFTTKRPGQGTGLGLSITHSILQRHSGTIQVESELNKGTTMIFSIPSVSR